MDDYMKDKNCQIVITEITYSLVMRGISVIVCLAINKMYEGVSIMQKKIDAIVTWLTEQVEQTKVEGLIVGLSGGLDSAVVAHLMERACPGRALAVIMPIHSNPDDLVDAQAVVETSGIQSLTVDLTTTHDQMFQAIQRPVLESKQWDEDQTRIANANLRARLRMSTLYTLATNYRYLVVGTDNAAEWYTGYFTKYGDGGVDIQPIIDLRKEEVFAMAKALGVPTSIVEKQPSADLWVGQTDEVELGTTYTYIDQFLRGEEIPAKDSQIIDELHKRTAHKRKLPPQCHLR